ncbi:MAG TPA: allantoicase [Polyangiaceae bacterium]|nr:allantoicase [Polyangiaceae bacterium]
MSSVPVCFANLVNLADRTLDARVVGASDDYFAAAENLITPGPAAFDAGKFTDRGKWMDGWESRRRRGPGHDWCILELGVTGECAAFDIDTQHFNGNQPAFASIDGALGPAGASVEELRDIRWQELLPQVPLQATTQNLFAAEQRAEVNYLRLNIFPDGGVARLRAFGRVLPRWSNAAIDELTAARVRPGAVDLAALKNGAIPVACSNAHFAPMHQLIAPGRARHMGGGWETRRRRGPGHDWIIVALAARGRPELVEIDTNHFKGNYPDRCSLELLDCPGVPRATDLIESGGWQTLLPETRLGPDARQFFDELPDLIATHVRLNVFPDGGVSRLRLWGRRVLPGAEG